jgi:hydroxymethylpyrimidine pyrophosphatase-like HAD family hydrolase
MSDIKLVVTDIDGTLVAPLTHDPTPAVREAIEAVQAHGVVVAAATARPYDMTAKMFLELGFRGPSVFDGGASIRDITTGELLWHNWLDLDRLQAIARLTFPHSKLIDFFPTYRPIDPATITPKEITEPAPYAWMLVKRVELACLQPELIAMGLNIHPGNGWEDSPEHVDVQITDKESDKFHAVEALRKLLELTKAQTLAIGDAGNDLPLFKAAGVKVAMGNAIPELKALADHIVAPVEQDGWPRP